MINDVEEAASRAFEAIVSFVVILKNRFETVMEIVLYVKFYAFFFR